MNIQEVQDKATASAIARRLDKLGAPASVGRAVRQQAISITKARAVLAAYEAPLPTSSPRSATRHDPPKPPARASAPNHPPKPTQTKKANTTMATAQHNAIVDEQRRAFFDARPNLPGYLRKALSDQPMSKVRTVVEAYEGKGHGQSVESLLLAGIDDPTTTASDRRAAQRALKAIGFESLSPAGRARLEMTHDEIQKVDPIGWQMGAYKQVESRCITENGRTSLGVPVYRKH